MAICIYDPKCRDFTTNGLGILHPLECTIKEQAAGEYELSLVHPIDDTLRWAQISNGCIIKAPAPVRESPLYESTEDIIQGTTAKVTRNVYTANTRRMYLRDWPDGSATRLYSLPVGTAVVLLEYDGIKWARVTKVSNGETGWCPIGGLSYAYSFEETVSNSQVVGKRAISLQQSRDQLFRIYEVQQDTELKIVSAKAMHIFYDQRNNLLNAPYEPRNVPASDVISIMQDNLLNENEFRIHAEHLHTKVTGGFGFKNTVENLLDPEEGIASQAKAIVIRDNFDTFLLEDQERDTGVTVRRKKNLIGVIVTKDDSDVVTRIVPVGKDQNGNPLFIPNRYVDSPRINDYPHPRAAKIEYDVSIGTPDADNADKVFPNAYLAMLELERLAKQDFENGIDLPTYGMEVDFVLLQNTPEYANFASLQAVHLYDTVTAIDELIGLKAKVRVTAYEWDAIIRQYKSITLGELRDLQQTVYSYNIPSGSLNGNKVINNTLDGAALRNLSVEYAKISNAAIKQLSADSITAVTARIEEIVADEIKTDELYAGIADIIALKVESLTASDIATDRLAAGLAAFTVITAGTASFDQATVQHLVANAMNLTFGTAGEVFIENLRVVYGQMVQATIGNLCIKASDGNYYSIDVNADGNVTATKTTVSDSEISAGETDSGRVILETNITAESLNTGNLLATYALINRIDAARIDVDELFAREAFIGILTTTKIVGDKSIVIMAQDIAANEAAIAKQNADLASAVTRLEKDISDIQSQVDGSITTWYYEGEPTLTNEPAVNWTTEEMRQEHQGDLYYDKTNGYSYRWLKEGNVWGWLRIVDTDVSTALSVAAAAKDTADAKKRIFYARPTPPYDPGDLWVQGSGGDIYVSTATKLAGFTFSQSDWKIASKYTDDTAANAAHTAANTAQSTANAATNAASKAQSTADAAKSTADTAVSAAGNAHARANAAYDLANGGVAGVDVQYYLSTSNTALIGGGWSTVAPEWVDGKYMWQRTVTTYKNGTTTASNPTCIAGATGATGPAGQDGQPGATGETGPRGETGVGVSSIIEQFYLSESKETQTGGSWVNKMPVWQHGYYVWTRSEITYTNGDVKHTEPYCDTGWEAANDAQTIATNAGATASAAVEAIGQIPQRVEVAIDGTYIKDENMASIMRLTSASVTIGTLAGDGAGYSQLASNYVQFGKYQLRKSADGGLVFKLKG